MEDREWMHSGWLSRGQVTDEWIDKTDAFLEMVFGEAAKGADRMFCPCSKCENRKRQTKKVMGEHLWKNGFTTDYSRWIYHGEADRIREEVVRQRVEDYDADAGVADMLDDFHGAQFAEGRTEEEPEASAKAFYKMLDAAQKPLHAHTTVSQLDAIGRVMALKSQYSWSREGFDAMLTVFASMLPEGHILPKSLYESQKLLRALKMPYDKIHACPKGCVLFRKEHAEEKYCPKCKSSRFLEVDSGDGHKTQLQIPVAILRYLPFIPRIQRLYMSEESAKQMTWHKNGKRYNPEKMVHASDGEAWRHFDTIHHEKARDARNVRIALATDGFNPYGDMAATYTCWPVFVIPLNLPPGVCFQRQNVLLSLIIPGHPGDKMGVFMEPLIDDLVRAWEEGVWTYDRATKTNFKMHVWYQYSMHDFLAYGVFSGWCVQGKCPCPVCKEDLKFNWLPKGGKYSSFDKHRQFLPLDHPFRRDIKNFTKGVAVTDLAPPIKTSAVVRQHIDGLVVKPQGGFEGYSEQHFWTHKSGLTRLPYYDDLLLPHNIDVMHTEKNVAESVWGTLMDIPGKTKDNVKARLDIATLCDRRNLEMQPPGRGKTWTKPKADYVLSKDQRKEVLQWIKTLMFPDGYAANLSRGVNLSTMRVLGMKSHDYHIWIERLLPVMVRGYVPERVWLVLAELSYFFRQLCAKELSRTLVADLERSAPVLVCKLEKIFPPSFFNKMEHLILHLPYEARMGGPVLGRWCYPIERCLKVLRKKCGNKCKIEASMAEAYILEEVSNFTTTYYGDNLPSVHNPPPRYNANENESTLSIFRGQLGTASGSVTKTLSHQEWRQIMMYVLTNLEEMAPYIEQFICEFWRQGGSPAPQQLDFLLSHGAGNGGPNFISWIKHKVSSDLSCLGSFHFLSFEVLLTFDLPCAQTCRLKGIRL
jgi:hypothetical protein